MQQLGETRSRPRWEKLWQSSQLLCFALLRLVSQISLTLRPTAAGGSTEADLGASTGMDFTPAGSTTEGWVDFAPAAGSTALSPA